MCENLYGEGTSASACKLLCVGMPVQAQVCNCIHKNVCMHLFCMSLGEGNGSVDSIEE